MTTATKTAVKVGDIFYTSWGYDQTNVDYYGVIEVSKSGKTVKLREVTAKVVQSDAYNERVAPSMEFADTGRGWCANCRQRIEISRYGSTKGKLIHYFTNETDCMEPTSWNGTVPEGYGPKLGTKAKRPAPKIYTKRVREYDGKPVLSWASYCNAYLWEGGSQYRTGPYGGH